MFARLAGRSQMEAGRRRRIAPAVKYCPNCQKRRHVSAFALCRSRYDGLQSKCRECAAQQQRSPTGKATQARAQLRYRLTERGKEARRRAQARYRRTLKGKAVTERCRQKTYYGTDRQRAHRAVAHALASGKLRRPPHCQSCHRSTQGLHAHHHRGYSERHRLTVRWLCPPCHRRSHHPPPPSDSCSPR